MRPLVACLCAAWCGACRDYGPVFSALASAFSPTVDFIWIDVEDAADALGGDIDITDFPTLLIVVAESAAFFGPITPQRETAERLIRRALQGTLLPAHTPPSGDLMGRIRGLLERANAAGNNDGTIRSLNESKQGPRNA